jgi:hypothetical protein
LIADSIITFAMARLQAVDKGFAIKRVAELQAVALPRE